MKLIDVVSASTQMTATRSRLKKTDVLATLLVRASPEEVPILVAYLSGSVPQGRLGIGYAGIGAMRGIEGAEEPELELRELNAVFGELKRIAGVGSGRRRTELLRQLFRRATPEEGDFLRRLLMGDLRQGSLEGIMLEAVAKAAGASSADVRRAWMLSGDLGVVARAVLAGGADALARFRVEIFRPIQPMLAGTAEDVDEALETLGRAGLEHKLDGARIQVHKRGDEVGVFSRRLNDVTHACPEVVEAVRALPGDGIILDGEAIALKKDGRPYPFQITMRRFGRRLDVAAMRRALPLESRFFDCLYFDGEPLLDRGNAERFRALSERLPEALLVRRLVTGDVEEARSFAGDALAAGHEGIMAKALEAPYAAGSRGKGWLKVKSARSLDLVVLAAEWGSGRRRGWLSNLHLGARDPENGDFVMLGKTFKGMTDAILKWQTRKLQEIEISRDQWTVHVRPELVVEVAFNDIQKSPHYPGGLALRFARLKGYREDKGPEEADTIATVRAIYRKQTGQPPSGGQTQLSLL